MTSSILCSGCGAQLRLSAELVRKLAGRTGRLSCKLCGAKLRVDGRSGPLTVKLDGGASVGAESAASLLTRVSATTSEFEAGELESVAPAAEEEFTDAAPFLLDSATDAAPPELKSEPIPSIFELARQSQKAQPKRRLSIPAPRDVAETWSAREADDEVERPLPSSPEAERREELRALYDEIILPPPPAAGSVTSRAPRPPLRSSASPRGSASPPLEAPLLAPSVPAHLAGGPPSVPPLQPARGSLASGSPLALSIAPSTPPPASSRAAMWVGMLAAGVIGGLVSGPLQRWFADGVAVPGGVAARPLAAASLQVRAELPAPTPLPSAFSWSPVAEVEKPADARRRTAARVEPPVDAELKPLPEGAAPVVSAEPEPEALPPFDEASASVALRQATIHAGGCRTEGDPTGQTKVVVTFAPSGRATTATLSGPPFAGTETGSCIAARFRSVRVAPFSGQHVTLTRDVVIY